MKRILIVEDNVDLASGLRRNLEVEGHKATVAGTARFGEIELPARLSLQCAPGEGGTVSWSLVLGPLALIALWRTAARLR